MKLPLSWLSEYVDISGQTPKTLSDMLLNIGFEVEEIIVLGQNIENVVTGRVISVTKHPDADSLVITEIDIGNKTLIIVTGARNVNVGDIVPVALEGARLPNGLKIKTAKLRGVLSYGMLCSGRELEIDDNVIEGAEADGILILPKDTATGCDIRDVLGLNDCVLDISVTANRPDCQSVYGMAREIAAMLNKPLKQINLKYKTMPADIKLPCIKIEDYALCSRYKGTIVKDVKIQKSPKWMRDRLRMCNVRAINNIVDITNYVLLETGQPLHAFDTRFIEGDIHVRGARYGESVTALNGTLYKLNSDNLVIADNNKILAIAGVMGGEYTSVFGDTQSLLLESARFNRGNIRRTSRAIALRSDSSARFEKGVDYVSVDIGSDRALALIEALKCGVITELTAQDGIPVPEQKRIKTDAKQISALLGIDINVSDIIRILKNLEITTVKDKSVLECIIPLFREDIDNYTDLAEEIIRFYGYNNIVAANPVNTSAGRGGLSACDKNLEAIKNLLCSFGIYETVNYSFINNNAFDKLLLPKDDALRNAIPLLNPLSEELAVMRTQLASSILNNIQLNTLRKNNNYRIFELSKVFLPKSLPLETLPQERFTLCIALVGEGEDFYALKNIVTYIYKYFGIQYSIEKSGCSYLHPGVSADIRVENNVCGSFGKLHPYCAQNFQIDGNVYIAHIDLCCFIARPPRVIKYEPLAKFPFVERDLAVVVDDSVLAGDIILEISNSGTNLLKEVKLFDVYKGDQIEDGKKSLAFSLVLQSNEKTLSENEIQSVMDKILIALKNKFTARLR